MSALTKIPITPNLGLGAQLKSVSAFTKSLRDQVNYIFGVMNSCFNDTGTVANNNYATLETTFGIASGGTSTGDQSNGYKAWFKVATLRDVLNNNLGAVDAAINDLA